MNWQQGEFLKLNKLTDKEGIIGSSLEGIGFSRKLTEEERRRESGSMSAHTKTE